MKTALYFTMLLMLVCGTAISQTAFTSGNIVVSRISNGAGPYSTTNPVFLDEYTPAGAFVRTHALPTTGTSLYQSYSVEEGYLTRAVNGQYLTLVGYTVAEGSGSGFSAFTSAVNPRAIGLVKYDGSMNVLVPPVTTTAASGVGKPTAGTSPTQSTILMSAVTGTIAVGQYVYGNWINWGATVASVTGTSPNLTVTLSNSGGTTNTSSQNYVFMSAATPLYANTASPGSAVTTDGTGFWLCSRASSLEYYNSTTGTLNSLTSGYTSSEARFLNIYDGQLYGTNDYGNKITAIGTGSLPTAGPASTAALSYQTSPNSFPPGQPKGFCMVDASTTVAGSDVLYVIQSVTSGGGGSTTNNAIIKYCKIGGLWQVNGGYGAYTDNYQSITAAWDGTQVTLYAIRKYGATGPGGELVKIVDAGGYSGSFSGTETILAAYNTGSSPLGGSWRGVAFAPNNASLPLNLPAFSGKQAGKSISLAWTTANEINVSGFEIERGINGNSFKAIGTTVATGAGNYSFTDDCPLPGTNYYRLKMIDKDGTFTYSTVVEVSTMSAATLSVYPNPATDQVTINHNKVTTDAFITIYSLDGKKVLVQQLAAGNTHDLVNVGRLASGNYIVSLNINNTTSTTELIKK